jgi:hypothetical protein
MSGRFGLGLNLYVWNRYGQQFDAAQAVMAAGGADCFDFAFEEALVDGGVAGRMWCAR